MTKAEKREQRIRENPHNVSLDEFEALINHYGHINFGGRHALAVIGKVVFPYKRANPISPFYVEQVLKSIDEFKKCGSEST